MSRRPQDPADEFSHFDLSVAGQTTKRGVQFIADHGLLPGDRSIRDMKRICVIGAFVSAGAPALVAGRLAEKLLWSFNQNDGEVPTGLSFLARKLPDALRSLPQDAEPNDYWYHRDLFRHPSIYKMGQALRGDVVVEIADREHVYLSHKNGLPLVDAFDHEFPKTAYEGWIEGWERGSEPQFHHLSEQSHHMLPELQEKAFTHLKNAVGLLTVNVSLAIRNGLDRLAIYRSSKPTRGGADK